MGDIVFTAGDTNDDGYAKISDEGCCPCCGGPCFDNCSHCEERPKDPPTCCTGRCCTCFPGSIPVIDSIVKGTDEAVGRWPPFSDVELEASFFLADCVYNDDSGSETTSPCNGYLGSITLCGSDKIYAVKQNESDEDVLPGGIPALCIRGTDAGGTSPHVDRYAGQDCTKQICNQKNAKGQPEEGGLPIYEIWCGTGRICYEDQKPHGSNNSSVDDNAPKDDGGCEYSRSCQQDKAPKPSPHCGHEQDPGGDDVPVGQFVEMSICCCKGNNDPRGEHSNPDCNRAIGAEGRFYNCDEIKKEIEKDWVDIDQVCSCACYTVDFKFHDVTTYPFIINGGEPGDNKCWVNHYGPHVFPASTCTNTNAPACPEHSKCPMEITDCRCMDVTGSSDDSTPLQPTAADGWYICAEYQAAIPWSCTCCAGSPNEVGMKPPWGNPPPRGGCKSGSKMRVFITVRDNSKARHNTRDSQGLTSYLSDYCPTCPSS